MNSHTTERFRKALAALPHPVRRQARDAYKLFRRNSYHPSLRFKRVHPTKPIYSVRIGLDYRALGVQDKDEIVWFWIGPHQEYDRLITQL
jgi:mRNA-degrading endonuclease RelE of RelBE toxin-antitoxin system